MNLKIAFVGHNAFFTNRSFRNFITENANEISFASFARNYAKFKDGTEVFATPPFAKKILGRRFDQIIFTGIIEDLPRFEMLCRLSGQVPLEHAIMFYEY